MSEHDHGPPSDDRAAELSQIEAMNQIEADEGNRRVSPPGAADQHSGARSRENADPASRRRDVLLLDTGSALAGAESVEEVLKSVATLYAPDFPLDGQVVFGVSGRSLTTLGQYGFGRKAEESFRMPAGTDYPAAVALRTGDPVFLPSTEAYRAHYPATWQISAGKGRGAWAFLPLATSGRITGVWMAAFRAPLVFTADERNLLITLAGLIARALERTHTGEAEMALSRGLRSSMGANGSVYDGMTVATRYVPTGGGLVVGGDWYDAIDLPGGRLALVIGDVQGHDVHAAGLMAQLRPAVHAYAAEGHGPDAVLARASRFLTGLDPDRFATCLYVEADPAKGTLSIARAGHPHPVLRLPDGTCLIKHVRGGLPLGLMPGGEDYPVSVMELHRGEIMMLCTDGLIETGGHDMYSGWVRVRDAFSPGPVSDLEGMADRLIGAVNDPLSQEDGTALAPRNEDDIALLLVRRDDGGALPSVPQRRLVLTIEQEEAEGLSEARAELQALMHDWAEPDQVDTAMLLASELLGNVLVHTDQAAALIATVSGEHGARTLRVEVADSGDELPHQRTPGELASSGRGLMLMDILSDECGVRPETEGKTVWFALEEGSGSAQAGL
ncbi:SpoIIE family protein phosphatase [Streptomyces sp. NPDC051976]|uniref:ATP-binding SpoIIE family protein phosphatase n=1 Tax=Streptomyces sp. NPDC051976 TaxID=3154947 RepID=UPI0034461679